MQEETMKKEDALKNYTPDSNCKIITQTCDKPSISIETKDLGDFIRDIPETDSKIRLIPKLADIMAYFKEYCDAAGLHGVRYLSEDRRNYFEKIFWWTILILCAVGCAFMIAKVKRKLDTTPVVVTFAESETNIWHLPFPAVTICPFTKFHPSLFNFTNFAQKFQDKKDFVDDYVSYLERLESKIEISDRRLYHMNGSSSAWIKETFSKRMYNDSYWDEINEELVVVLEQMLQNRSSQSLRKQIQDVCNSTSLPEDVSPSEEDEFCNRIRAYYPVWLNENKQKLMALGPVCGLYFPWWHMVFENSSFILDENAPKYLMKVALSMVDIHMLWNLQPITGAENLKQIWTAEGRCYTFNMVNNGEIFYDNELSYEFSSGTEKESSNDWHPDTGYSAKAGRDAYPRRSGFADQYSGLRLGIDEATDGIDHLCNMGFTGYKIILHRPEDYPQAHLHFDVDIPFNKHASISINPSVMTTSRELETYDARRRQCYLSREKQLEYFKFYSKNNCLLECLTKATLKKCGCVAFYMPRNASTKMCGSGLQDCVAGTAQELEQQAMDDHLKKLSEDEVGTFSSAITKTDCDCLPSCLSISYEADASIVERNLSKAMKILRGVDEDDKKSHSIIVINYKNGYFIASRRSELYGKIDFLANCGGLLGLFSGFSLISLVEFVYFLTIRLWSNIIRRWATNRKIHHNPNKA